MGKKKVIELNDKERKAIFIKICDSIILNMEIIKNGYIGDLSDIGNEVGEAVGLNTCKDKMGLNMLGVESDDFIRGYHHGYSLQDGTHG